MGFVAFPGLTQTIYLVPQQNVVSKPSILAAMSALRTVSRGLVCEPDLYIYKLNVKYIHMEALVGHICMAGLRTSINSLMRLSIYLLE